METSSRSEPDHLRFGRVLMLLNDYKNLHAKNNQQVYSSKHFDVLNGLNPAVFVDLSL